MNLADALIHVPQDERGGEIAIRGFEYQRCWAIDELLNRHKKNESYVFIPEYHDDVLILNSSESPTMATFAQVKTRDTHWTITPLIKSDGEGKLSFISKLFKHKYDFSSYKTDLTFITNAVFKFFDKYEFNADELKVSEKDKILDAVKTQLPGFGSPDLSSLKFKTSNLSLLDYDAHLLGKTVEYLEDTKSSEVINAMAFKRTLVDLFEKKTRVSSREIKSFKELIDKKGISNELIAKLISEIKSLKTSFPDWEKISILLSVLHKDEFETLMLKIKYELFLVNVKDINSIEYDFYRLLKQKRVNEKFNAENIPIHIEEMISYALEESDEFRQLIDDDYKYIMACCAVIEKMSGNEAKK
ncbi:dsDNA nuclease domain-containing protein [Klebsiella pneumoniae]